MTETLTPFTVQHPFKIIPTGSTNEIIAVCQCPCRVAFLPPFRDRNPFRGDRVRYISSFLIRPLIGTAFLLFLDTQEMGWRIVLSPYLAHGTRIIQKF